MKRISIELAEAIQLFVPEETTPENSVYLPEMISAVSERYGFVKIPNIQDTIGQNASFENGRCQGSGKQITIKKLQIFSDGILIDASTTDNCSLAMDDFVSWMIESGRMKQPTTKVPRRFNSGVVVDFDKSLNEAFEKFQSLWTEIGSRLEGTFTQPPAIGFAGISFGTNPQTVPSGQKVQFTVERRIANTTGVPSKDRFFSNAPLRTEEHFSILEQFETLI